MSIWLPYRVRNWLNQRRLATALGGLDRTQPFEAASPNQAKAEVFMLVCKRDLAIACLALKSLLRFADGQLAVTISNDGSLSAKDQAWLTKHIPNHRWLPWPDQSVADDASFANRPLLKKLYESDYAPAAKLLHPFTHRRLDRALILDSDTAFFEHPTRLEAWWTGEDETPLFMHDHQDESDAKVVPPAAEEAFGALHEHVKENHGANLQWQLDRRLFNSGLLAYNVNQVDLELAEIYLNWRASIQLEATGQMSIWFGQWTPEQTCYHVMFTYANQPPQPLGEEYWLGVARERIFNHFLRHYLLREQTHDMLRELVAKFPQI